MTSQKPNKQITLLAAVGLAILFFYLMDASLGNKDIASAPVGAERAVERKEARTALEENAEKASESIEAAKKIILDEWGEDSSAGYKLFTERVEKVYPTAEVDEALDEFE